MITILCQLARARSRCAFILLTSLTLALAGCSPSFNWREIRPDDQGFAVLMPDRPASMSREIDLDGLRVTMSMTGAKIDRSMFTVASVVLKPDQMARSGSVLEAMRDGMVRNISAERSSERGVSVSVTDLSGRVIAREPGLRIEARGRVNAEPVQMTAIFVARSTRLWQVVAIEPAGRADQASTMIDSFRILE